MDSTSIRQLDSSVSKLLTTTQVITSPTNVVKELIENSMDGNATSIVIKLEAFGLEKVEVTDNGSGIWDLDAPFMALNNYTSKISNQRDLNELYTYGFRGQGLTSICSMANVTVSSKVANTDVGTMHVLNCDGHIVTSKQCSMNQGTIVLVTKLFKNLPVRHKLYSSLKKKREELKKMEDLLKSFSIIQPHIRFMLYHDQIPVWQKGPTADIASALRVVLSAPIAGNLTRLSYSSADNSVAIEAHLPKVNAPILKMGRLQTDMTYTFVNKRPVNMPILFKLLKQHYSAANSLPVSHGKYPISCVSIELPSNNVDVNLNPDKTLIFFCEKESVTASLESVLADHYGTPLFKNSKKEVGQKSPGNSQEADEVLMDICSYSNGCAQNKPTTPNQVWNLFEEADPRDEDMSNKDVPDNGIHSNWTDDDFTVKSLIPQNVNGNLTVNAESRHINNGKKTMPNVNRHNSSDDVGSVENNTAFWKKSYDLFEDAEQQNNMVGKDELQGMDVCSHPVDHDSSSVEHQAPAAWNLFEDAEERGIDNKKGNELTATILGKNGQCKVASQHLETFLNKKLAATEWSRGCHKDSDGKTIEAAHILAAPIKPKRQLTLGLSFQNTGKVKLPSREALSSLHATVARSRKEFHGNIKRVKMDGDMDDRDCQPRKNRHTVKQGQIRNNNKNSLRINVIPKTLASRRLAECQVEFNLKRLKDTCMRYNSSSSSRNSKDSIQIQSGCQTIEVVGRLPNGFWVVTLASSLEVVNHYRLWESLIYSKLLESHCLAVDPLLPMDLITESVIGQQEWQTLANLSSKSRESSCGPRSFLLDKRITDSGFSITILEAPEDDGVALYLTGVTKEIPNFGISDLKECLRKLSVNDSIGLSECRPSRVEEYLKNMATNMALRKTQLPCAADMMRILCTTSEGQSANSTCLHGRSITTSLGHTI